MIGFEVYVDGRRICLAAVPLGVASAILTRARRKPPAEPADETVFSVGGLQHDDGTGLDEYLDWFRRELPVGSEITLRIVETDAADEPAVRRPVTPEDVERSERKYYERLKAKYESKGDSPL